jgi:hypothetical protein
MTYMHCDQCGYRVVRGSMSLVDSCPRCRRNGHTVSLRLEEASPYARTHPVGGAPETGVRAPS